MFHVVPENVLCTTTSCHSNFDPGTLSSFCKHDLRLLALSLWKSVFYTLLYIDRLLLPLAALTYLTILVQSTPVDLWLSYLPLDPRFAGSTSNPARVDGFFFQSVKILSMTSFGREVKPWVPCRRFMVRKRTSSQN